MTENMVHTSPQPLYLIVATAISPTMGIGFKGQLPWPLLKTDMAFFARVTKRTGAQERTPSSRPTPKNAVIMGRKTWDSIPAKFRPLKGRVNVVVTRGEIKGRTQHHLNGEDVVVVNSISAALSALESNDGSDCSAMEGSKEKPPLGKIFIVGGSEIYRHIIDMQTQQHLSQTQTQTQIQMPNDNPQRIIRILQTQVRHKDGTPFECDTFFPLTLGDRSSSTTTTAPAITSTAATAAAAAASSGNPNHGIWKQQSAQEVETWIGENLPQGPQEAWKQDGDMEMRVVGWEWEWD